MLGNFDQISACSSFTYSFAFIYFYFIVNWFLSIVLILRTVEYVAMQKLLVKKYSWSKI